MHAISIQNLKASLLPTAASQPRIGEGHYGVFERIKSGGKKYAIHHTKHLFACQGPQNH